MYSTQYFYEWPCDNPLEGAKGVITPSFSVAVSDKHSSVLTRWLIFRRRYADHLSLG